MEGYVYRDCADAVYVPLYLTPYEKAVTYFPPFLRASTCYGYQVPEHLPRMMNKLFKNCARESSSQRTVKDKEFSKRLKELSKDYLGDAHSGCSKSLCEKVCLFVYYCFYDIMSVT